VSGLLLFLLGAALGALAGWIAARRPHVLPPVPPPAALVDEILAESPETALPAGLSADAPFETLARALVDRCAYRVSLPCVLVMRDVEGGPASIVSLSSGLDPRLLGLEVPLDSPAGSAITSGVPVVGPADEPVLRADTRDRRRPLSGGVAAPVRSGARVIGAVVAFGEPASGGGDAVAGMSALVRRFEPALAPAHSVHLAQRRAETDELTGLPNRRALKAAVDRTAGERAALIMLDIDHFKQINDTLGHPAGDAALRHLARLLKDAVRGRDLAARVGGEEFAVWVPGADVARGTEVAERLRRMVEANPFSVNGSERVLTISCGVAAYPVPIGAPENLVPAADAALYRAKREGRNRVSVSMAEMA
jgi:diguanylate cyclase (GGDEF)-like protein